MSENVTASPSTGELIRTYARLGCTSFGGPVAHIGYYRREFIEQTGWMDDEAFGERLALCQALPGPTSSQMAFACAWHMSGSLGVAFLCLSLFLVPSMLILLGLGLFFVATASGSLGSAWLKNFMGHLSDWMVPLVIAVITHATLGMARSLSVGATRRLTTILAFVIVLALPLWDFGGLQVFAQLLPIVFGAIMGLLLMRGSVTLPEAGTASSSSSNRPLILFGLVAFFGLLGLSLFIILGQVGSTQLQLMAGFYEAGSLVFGGGHVVLPLLNDVLVEPGLVAESSFRTGYGFAQAIPGPVFAVAAFLGGQYGGLGGIVLGLLGTVAIFLPGILLVMAVVPLAANFSQNRTYKAALAGVNAAVVGLLGATAFSLFFLLWSPGALILNAADPLPYVGAALVGLFFLWVLRLSPLVLIGLTLVAALFSTLL
ncbi:MAG: chromate efflux transporter [Alphaproteobacteria bacterium]